MFKKIVLLLIMLTVSPVFAGSLENAIKEGNYTFLYIYTPWCGTCKNFNPVYNKLASIYAKKYKFIKINGETPYGYELCKKFKAGYVPFTAVFKPKTGEGAVIPFQCASNYSCAEKFITNFRK